MEDLKNKCADYSVPNIKQVELYKTNNGTIAGFTIFYQELDAYEVFSSTLGTLQEQRSNLKISSLELFNSEYISKVKWQSEHNVLKSLTFESNLGRQCTTGFVNGLDES